MITVRLIKPLKQRVITFEARELTRDAGRIVVRAEWHHGPIDLGVVRFDPGDVLDETYYSDRWYNVFEIRSGSAGRLKGWYCNVTRPALIGATVVESEDLELDLLVSADRRTIRLDDEAEFAARDLLNSDPQAHAAALAAVAELRMLAVNGLEPFTAGGVEDGACH
jgi:hypothetical protein